MTVFELFKRFKLLETFCTFSGCFGILSCNCVIFCFFYMNYKDVAKGFLFPDQERFTRVQIKGSSEYQRGISPETATCPGSY